MCECVVDAFGGALRGMCVYYVFERGMDRGADGGGRARDSTRNESGLERETNMTSRREIPLSVYMQGGVDRGTRRIFLCVCGVCVGMCGCEKIMRHGGRGCVTA